MFFKITIRGVFTTGSVIFFGVTLALCIVAKQPSIPYELSPLQTLVPVQEAVCFEADISVCWKGMLHVRLMQKTEMSFSSVWIQDVMSCMSLKKTCLPWSFFKRIHLKLTW